MLRVLWLLAAATVFDGFALAAAQEPDASEVRRAREHLAAGRTEEAIAGYTRILERRPGDPGVLTALAVAEYKAARYRDAARHAEEALRSQPGQFVASLFLGASLLKLGESDRAVPPLERAAQAQPDDRNARLMLGEALLGNKRYAAAAEQFEAAARLMPESPRAWFGIYASHSGMASADSAGRAAAALGRLKALPDSPELHQAAAMEHESRGRWSEAVSEWRKALEALPDDRMVRRSLVLALYQANDPSAGLALLERPVRSDPESAELQFLYGAGLLNMQQTERALKFLSKAVALDPRLIPARAALGQAYLQAGRPDEAIPHLRAAVSDDPDGSRHYQLARALQASGRREEAAAALREYENLRRRNAER